MVEAAGETGKDIRRQKLRTRFGGRLRELREQAGMTQRELADKIGTDFTYVSKIENGVMPPPSQKVILRLAEVLNSDKDELMALAGKIPSDIAHLLDREALQFLRQRGDQGKTSSMSFGAQTVVKLRTRIFQYGKYTNLSELAQAMGISVGQVCRVRQGKRNINRKFIVGATKAFPRYKLDDLFYVEGSQNE